MKRIASATLSLAALSACAPLQQAPLVYSSKSVVGLDVSATTTETPGASFAFGWKSVDAAYVPVAVARTCEGKSDCSSGNYRLEKIGGNYRDTSNGSASDDTKQLAEKFLQQFQQAVTEDRTARLEDEVAEKALLKAQLDLKEERARLQVIEGKAEDARSAAEKDALAGKAKRLEDLERIVSGKEEVAFAAKQKAAEREAALKKFDAKKVLDAKAAATGTDKNDAYSVFGSFDANTKSEISTSAPKQDGQAQVKIEPTLVLGKVFSTGVASQNLTEGMHKYYAAMAFTRTAQAMSDCVASASKVAETVKGNEEIVKAAFEACRAIDRMQQYKPADDRLRQAAATQ